VAGEASGHPVIDALGAALVRRGLNEDAAEAMIEARGIELSPDPPADLAALRDYLAGTAGSVFQVAAAMLGAQGEHAAEASTHAGLAYGLTGIMLALPHHAARGRILLPADLLARHGLHANVVLHGDDNADLRAALRDLAAMAGAALEEARQSVAALPSGLLPAFLPLAVTGASLKALAAPGHHPLRDIAQLNPLRRFGLIWRAHLRGRL
jgi:phytoene synthase